MTPEGEAGVQETSHAPGETAHLDVDGRPHQVTVQLHPETRKAAVRVDGRMALPPFPADGRPRPFTLAGREAGVSVEADGSFRLGIGGPSAAAHALPSAAPARTSTDSGQRNLVIGVVAMMAAMALPAVLRQARQHKPRSPSISWQTYSTGPGRYVAEFPGPYVESQKDNPLPGGGTEHDFLVEANLGEKGDYAVLYVDLPEGTRATHKEMMQVTSLIQARVHGVPQTSTTLDPRGWGIVPCVESTASLPNGGKLIVRAWMDRSRQYTALAAYSADGEADARRFIDSVQPLGGPRP
jgi:hypothetical protein